MAYIVGLTATDGCLFTGVRKINFKSADRDLVATYRDLLGRTNRIVTQRTRTGGSAHLIQFGDARLYRWFQSIGLTPRKSLTLGAIAVPDAFLAPVLRGLFDGDGHIENFTHHPTLKRYPNYRCERLRTSFYSASRQHVEWIRGRVAQVFSLEGAISKRPGRGGRHDFFRLTYGKVASEKLLPLMYPSAEVPMLRRKWSVWNDYARRHALN